MNIEHGNPLAETAPAGSKIMILFASETGTAEEFAFDLGNAIQSNHFNCEVCDLDDINPKIWQLSVSSYWCQVPTEMERHLIMASHFMNG